MGGPGGGRGEGRGRYLFLNAAINSYYLRTLLTLNAYPATLLLTSLAREGVSMSNQNAYRLTITVPRAVKEQMDQVAEQVNWSAVATEAFQRKVIEIRAG